MNHGQKNSILYLFILLVLRNLQIIISKIPKDYLIDSQ